MLISDMARKAPSEMSAISAIAGVRVGQVFPVHLEKFFGHQIGDQDAGEETGHEERQHETGLRNRLFSA
jgi:hypothetical protein